MSPDGRRQNRHGNAQFGECSHEIGRGTTKGLEKYGDETVVVPDQGEQNVLGRRALRSGSVGEPLRAP
jgi:hypothetical protein